MKLLQTDSPTHLAECAAKITIDNLKAAILEFGEATWVLAGGNTPLASYRVIASKYSNALDWQKVWFVIGDERHVQLSDSSSNWGAVENALLNKLNTNEGHLAKPVFQGGLSDMASSYIESLSRLPKAGNGLPRLDQVWLGLGDDGHTLSLFPGRNLDTNQLVEQITDSPKPPSERISLTIYALRQTRHGLILASGENKARMVKGLVEDDQSLPISQVVRAIEDVQGRVCVLCDNTAS